MLESIPEHQAFVRLVDYWFAKRDEQGLPVRETLRVKELGTAANDIRILEVTPNGQIHFHLTGKGNDLLSDVRADNYARMFQNDVAAKVVEHLRNAERARFGLVLRVWFGKGETTSGHVDLLCLPVRSIHRPVAGFPKAHFFVAATSAAGIDPFVANWRGIYPAAFEIETLEFDVGLPPAEEAVVVDTSREAGRL